MTRIQRFTGMSLGIAAIAMLSACAGQPYYGNTNYPMGSQPGYSQQSYQSLGTVTNVELVRAGGSSGIAGTAIGGVAGGVLGNQVGGGSGRTAATVIGAVGGALIGNAIERNSNAGRGADVYRVSVRLDNGATQSFDYQQSPNVRIGDRVRVDGNQLYR
ncbi:glycine zipper 2TM domain-containing protein [Ottowia caeni]|uniref:glycine zipper 2TM domain-containing protein n=1 Tax=Ottowia caeni TaxID=2870339 RepID=UPI001E2C2789|nr:glycine zipper 2TM domain-containing protein [Ottowia caeni]